VTIHRRRRAVAALVATGSLVLAACGTRLDHDTIVRAGSGVGAGEGFAEDGALADGTGPGKGRSGTKGGPGGPAGASGDGPGRSAGAGSGNGSDGGPGGPGRVGNKEPLVIGTVGAYSGPGGTALAQGARALQVWGASVNAKGGVDGHPVKVIVMDDGGDAAKARSLMKELVEERKAVAVVGAMTVVETLNSWRKYVEEKRMPVVGGSCGPEWTASPMLFRQCPGSPAQVYGTARIGAKFGKSKQFGALFCSETESCTFVERELFNKGGAKRAGLDPRYRARISVFQADFTAECIQARNSGVKLLMVVADPGTVERVASSCRRQGLTPQYLQIASTLRADAVRKPGLSDVLAGMSVFPFDGLSTPAFREFDAAWARYGGGQAPGPAAAQGWASGKLFEKAVRTAGGDISRASIVTALRKLRGERLGGLTAPMTFGANGPTDVPCLYYMRGTGGRWTAPQGDKLVCW
jgi:branched-chain amino acid transport system substrate-binding protein